MNWGNKLVLVFVGFATLIGTLVYKSMHTKFELVSKDYYNDELRYQDKIDGKINAAKVGRVTVVQTADSVVINFPDEHNGHTLTGEAWFYCSVNAANDRRIPVKQAAGNQMVILKENLARANYRLKLTWQDEATKYYDEQQLSVY